MAHYTRPPAWRYFPQTDFPPPPLAQIAEAMASLDGWFKSTFWPAKDAGAAIETKDITRQLETHLKPDPASQPTLGGLSSGWNVETREPYARVPLLYGEDGKTLYGVEPDAIFVSPSGTWTLLEIEGGGAVANNRLMKDIIESLLIPRATHLALVVPHVVHGRSPFDFAVNLIQALYARRVPQEHLAGIMVVGY
jgi:hypothetical protein